MAGFPDVPFVQGVPTLARDVSVAFDLPLLVTDLISYAFGGFEESQWGIFLNGVPVILADSVISIEYAQDWDLPSAPQEEGGFQTYNKVNSPFSVKLRFAQGGSDSDRQNFLSSIDAAVDTLDLYDVVTPEAVYQSVNLSHYDYKRTSTNGVGLIVVDVWCTEIRVTANSEFSSTKDASGAAQTNDGTVSPTSVTSPQQASVVERLPLGDL